MIDLRVPAGTSTPRAPAEPDGRDVARRHRELFGSLGPNQVRALLSQALLSGDRDTARRIYFAYIVPGDGFSNSEVDRLSYRVGAIDEGDRDLALGADL
jgi:hypothetical protein